MYDHERRALRDLAIRMKENLRILEARLDRIAGGEAPIAARVPVTTAPAHGGRGAPVKLLPVVTSAPPPRAECPAARQPCPNVSCRLRLDASGACAIDLAESNGPMSIADVGVHLGVTKERVAAIERQALARLGLRARRLDLGQER